jgi:hypothetical protein
MGTAGLAGNTGVLKSARNIVQRELRFAQPKIAVFIAFSL